MWWFSIFRSLSWLQFLLFTTILPLIGFAAVWTISTIPSFISFEVVIPVRVCGSTKMATLKTLVNWNLGWRVPRTTIFAIFCRGSGWTRTLNLRITRQLCYHCANAACHEHQFIVTQKCTDLPTKTSWLNMWISKKIWKQLHEFLTLFVRMLLKLERATKCFTTRSHWL